MKLIATIIMPCIAHMALASFGREIPYFMKEIPRIDSLTCRAEPIPKVIYKLHTIIQSEYTNQQFSFTLYLRDTRVIEKPESTVLTHDQITGYSDNSVSTATDFFANISSITLNLTNVNLLDALDIICELGNYEYELNAPQNGVIAIVIGPAELIGSHSRLRRRTFHFDHLVPNGLHDYARELSATGPSLAFNPDSSLLTVIDDPTESFSDKLIELLGAKLIYTEIHKEEM